jgi:hypothetical protein
MSGTSRSDTSSSASAGVIVFASVMMMIIGIFDVFTGLAALIRNELYVVTQDYVFKFDVTTWGWIHLVLGTVVFLAGLSLLTGATWARMVAVFLAAASAIANFAAIPYYPVWSIILIAVDILVIWALTTYRGESLVD